MDRLIEIPIWVIFWIFFIGALGGAFFSFWIDSVLEKWITKGNFGSVKHKKLMEIIHNKEQRDGR